MGFLSLPKLAILRCLRKGGPQQHVPSTAEKARVSQNVLLAFSPRPACRGNRFRSHVLAMLIAMATRDVDYI